MNRLLRHGRLIGIVSAVLLAVMLLCAFSVAGNGHPLDYWWPVGFWTLLGCVLFALMPAPAVEAARGLFRVLRAQSPPVS